MNGQNLANTTIIQQATTSFKCLSNYIKAPPCGLMRKLHYLWEPMRK